MIFMAKVDLKKEMKEFYNPSKKEFVIVDVPDMSFAMIDGVGDPNTSKEYQDSVDALYSVSYTLKFMIKKQNELLDYVVMPLEGLWWADDMGAFLAMDKDQWKWTSMIMQPDFVKQDKFTAAVKEAQEKKDLPGLAKIRFESFAEGLSAQIMYIGPFADEGPTIEKLHSFIKDNGYDLRGKHHEIYLSDPRRTAPEKMRTVIRQSIK